MQDISAQILVDLRDTDRDRYLACLLAPADKQRSLAALYAFNAEIARIRDLVHEPIPGEIRMQWWRDLIGNDAASGEGIRSPKRCCSVSASTDCRSRCCRT